VAVIVADRSDNDFELVLISTVRGS